MVDVYTRTITTKEGEFTVRILPTNLGKASDEGPKRTKSEQKFNIRVKQDDIYLLDALAKRHGVSRSTLINEILHEIMRDELMSIEEDDARVLLAHVADLSASYDERFQPWVYDALGSNFQHMLQNMLKYSNAHGQPPEITMQAGCQYSEEDYRSTAYLGLRNKLKGLTK